jgi:hypothetical protein
MPIAQKHQVSVSSVFGQTAFDAWAKNTQAITAEMADYSKKSFENSAAAFEKLIGAKSLERVMEVQTAYLRSSYEELAAVTTKIGELYADLAREAYKSFGVHLASRYKM